MDSKHWLLFFLLLIGYSALNGQKVNLPDGLDLMGDFRFRIEPDWNSKKSDGTFRDNRTRLRFRLRFGLTYSFSEYFETGFRLRTGQANKQQDPQITLGTAMKEFSTIPVGFEKLYFKTSYKILEIWVGKNTYPFTKTNELFFSDNVYPEGVYVGSNFSFDSKLISKLWLKSGHFLVAASNKRLSDDAYFQGFQVGAQLFKNRLSFFPAYYRFKNLPYIPDQESTFELDYYIFHLGGALTLADKPKIALEADYYINIEDYGRYDSIPTNLQEENQGLVIGLGIGQLKKKKDWLVKFTYMRLERFSAVDFLAQNDWARWDYSSFNSPDGRLTNYSGIELKLGYMVNDKLKLSTRFFFVEQLVAYGIATETNSRVRFDLDVKF